MPHVCHSLRALPHFAGLTRPVLGLAGIAQSHRLTGGARDDLVRSSPGGRWAYAWGAVADRSSPLLQR